MKKKILANVAAAALLSTFGVSTAQAVSPLAGGYAGIQGGYDKFSDSDLYGNVKGAEGGVYLGYNFQQAENLILGLEANFNLSDASKSETTTTLKVKNNYGISARAGYLATNKVMIYVRGGYQRALASISDSYFGIQDSQHFDGFSLGGGVEAAATDKISVRAEYVHIAYSHNSTWDIKPHQDNINVGIAYHF